MLNSRFEVNPFKDLFVFDLANNHQGSVEHAINILEEFASVAHKARIKAAIKFQMRDLATFIHSIHKNSSQSIIRRLLSTELKVDDFVTLKKVAEDLGFLTACTPFDEASVKQVGLMNFDYIKLASCSANDWPLLREIVSLNNPIIASTGGLEINEIDRLVNFLKINQKQFALMHCVSLYPTPIKNLELNQIGFLKNRYKDIEIGWSTHEDQERDDIVKVAYSQGARVFERHIGLSTEVHTLNNYSSTPRQIEKWLRSHEEAVSMCGSVPPLKRDPLELNDLQKLKRGVFLKKSVSKGQKLTLEDVEFAITAQPEQMLVNDWSEDFQVLRDAQSGDPLLFSDVISNTPFASTKIEKILNSAIEQLRSADVPIWKGSQIEISHHFGIKKFEQYGAVIFNCVNRAYCRKLLVLSPGQQHPKHLHKIKEETFFLLSGDLEIELNGVSYRLNKGDHILVEPNTWHAFKTQNGAVIEELSTTHISGDSIYEDRTINTQSLDQRKTPLDLPIA